MEPKWNVKSIRSGQILRRPSRINGTKVECKGINTTFYQNRKQVLMEPKWNVKDYAKQAVMVEILCINGTKVECKDL